MSQVILARHGETVYNDEARVQGQLDVKLSKRGIKQAYELAEEVANRYEVKRIYSSALSRAKETATIVADRLGIDEVYADARFNETDRGLWQERLLSDIQREEPEVYSQWRSLEQNDFRFPGGESLLEQQQRVVAGLEEIKRLPGVTLVICHGGSIRLALCHYLGQPIGKFHSWQIANCEIVKLDG